MTAKGRVKKKFWLVGDGGGGDKKQVSIIMKAMMVMLRMEELMAEVNK